MVIFARERKRLRDNSGRRGTILTWMVALESLCQQLSNAPLKKKIGSLGPKISGKT